MTHCGYRSHCGECVSRWCRSAVRAPQASVRPNESGAHPGRRCVRSGGYVRRRRSTWQAEAHRHRHLQSWSSSVETREHIHFARQTRFAQRINPGGAIANPKSVTTRPAGKRHEYHRRMLREDLSTRFDYLFEPVATEDPAGNGNDATLAAPPHPPDESRWFRWIVLSGVVLATLAVAAGTAVVMLQPLRPAEQTVIPADATPQSTPPSTVTSAAMAAPTPAATTAP